MVKLNVTILVKRTQVARLCSEGGYALACLLISRGVL